MVPLALLQASPQLAQLASVPRVVSQPAAAVQSPKPALQVPMVQVPVAHDAAAFGKPHATPQSPQLVSERMFVSQPFSTLVSQLLKPVAHVGVQA